MIKNEPLAYLINPYQKEDPRLSQILTKLDTKEQRLIDQSNLNEQLVRAFEYRFELPGARVPGMDVYPVWKQIRFPLDEQNNTIGIGQQITRIDINAKVPSASGSYVVDLLVTKDKGLTFESIFPSDVTQKLILPQDLNWIKYGGKFSLAADILQDGWWWRIDELVADGIVAGIEIVIRGVLNL